MSTSARGCTHCAIQLGNTAAEPVQPEFAGLGRDFILLLAPVSSPAAVVDTSAVYSSSNCKEDRAKRSIFLRAQYSQWRIRSSQEEQKINLKSRTSSRWAEMSRMESRRDICGMAMHTKSSRPFCVYTLDVQVHDIVMYMVDESRRSTCVCSI